MPYALLVLGCLAAVTGQPQRAARLFGAQEVLRERQKSPLPPMDQPVYAQGLERLRAQLDQATIDALWAEGRAMPLNEVLTYALASAGAETAC